jgi:hypothetical protein
MSGGKFGNPKLEDSEAIERWKAPMKQMMSNEIKPTFAQILGYKLKCWVYLIKVRLHVGYPFPPERPEVTNAMRHAKTIISNRNK